MPLPSTNFERTFVSSLYLRRSKTDNRHLSSNVVKNFTKQEIHRSATRRKGIKPISSFAAFPRLYKRSQGPLKKLIRTVDPLEYVTVPGLDSVAVTSSIVTNHFDLNSTPSSPQSRRQRRRKPKNPLPADVDINETNKIPLELLSKQLGNSVPVVNADGTWNINISKTATDTSGGWINPVEEKEAIPFNLEGEDTPKKTMEAKVMPIESTKLAIDTDPSVAIEDHEIAAAPTLSLTAIAATTATAATTAIAATTAAAAAAAAATTTTATATATTTNLRRVGTFNKLTTYGTKKTLDTVSLLPSWPKRAGSSFNPREVLRTQKIGLKRKKTRHKKNKKNTKNNSTRQEFDARKVVTRAEDKSHNMSTRLALMPRPLSRSASYNGVAIIRSRPGTSDDFWSNEILPWKEDDNVHVMEEGMNIKNNNVGINNVGVATATETQVIDRRPSSAKQREAQSRTYQRWEHTDGSTEQFTERSTEQSSQVHLQHSQNLRLNPTVRINICVYARLATINMSFEVNRKVLSTSSKGWTEIEVAEEVMTAMRATLDRDAKNLLEVSARKAAMDWQDTTGEWHPLTSGAAMKNCIHEKFHNLELRGGHKRNGTRQQNQPLGLNLLVRLQKKRPQTSDPQESRPQSQGLSIHDGDVGRNLLKSRSGSRGSSRGSNSRLSLSRNMNRAAVKKLQTHEGI